MKKNLVCIECPKGCLLSVDIENCRVVKVEGNLCPKGEKYAEAEVESPTRVLTSAVLTKGLELKMVPVRTNKPIPKTKIFAVMDEIKTVRLGHSVKPGDVIISNISGSGADLIVTRNLP